MTRWRARELDRRLAAGADPMESDELALRVGQLASPGNRARLSCALRGAVEVASGNHAPLTATRLRRSEIRRNEDLVLALADRVRDGGPLGVRGLAMTSRLLGDRASPLYSDGSDRSLSAAVFAAMVELDRGFRTAGTSGK